MKKFNAAYLITALLLSLGLGITGCATLGVPTRTTVQDEDLVDNSYQAADALLTQAAWLKDNRQPLLTATFVNVNALESSSALGRIIAEQVASRFSQQGFTMIDMKLRNNIFIKEGAGEFVLSRSVRDISQSQNAAAVVAGTYAVGRHAVYVSTRLIRATDSLILASYDYSLPLGPDTKALLASQ
jgi:TolB-like protein